MSLPKCDDCGKQYSPKAESCPYCGKPVAKKATVADKLNAFAEGADKFGKQAMSIGYGLIAIVVLLFVVAMVKSC